MEFVDLLTAETQFGKFCYYSWDDIGRRIATNQFLEKHFEPWFEKLDENSFLIDVGANIGFFTVYAARKGANVLAFEPSQQIYDLLVRNIEINKLNFRKVGTYSVPLYSKQCMLEFSSRWQPPLVGTKIDYKSMGNTGGLALVPSQTQDTNVEKFQWMAHTLDELRLTDKVTLIKVDTQGADLQVLRGAKNTIEKFRPVICFEYEEDGSGTNTSGDSMVDFYNFFAELGRYKVTCVAGNGWKWGDFVAEPL
jgi:FkbM family methyltransferase